MRATPLSLFRTSRSVFQNMNLFLRFAGGCCLLAVALALPMKARAQNTNAPLPASKFKFRITRTVEMPYLYALPPDYEPGGKKRWPLLLFLHGAGERGTDVQRVAIHGPLKLVRQGRSFPFIILAPLCPEGRRWETESLTRFLDEAVKKYAVDERRVYVTGLSMGGYGTWGLGLAQPERFAAIAPICGGGTLIDILIARRRDATALQTLPVWAFHGARDNAVPLEESERLINALRKLGAKEVKFTVYPDAGHDAWTETYNNPEFYDWLLSHHR
jgi:predicted peptidase